MSEIVYRSRVRIERKKGPLRHAFLPGHEGPVEFGVHDEIAEHYGIDVKRPVTATLDYVVAATGG